MYIYLSGIIFSLDLNIYIFLKIIILMLITTDLKHLCFTTHSTNHTTWLVILEEVESMKIKPPHFVTRQDWGMPKNAEKGRISSYLL